MALGDKRPVVMGAEKAVPGGVATLDADGKLTAAQRPSLAEIQGGSNPNLLINWDFRDPVNRNGKKVYNIRGYTIDSWFLGINDTNIELLNSEGIKFSANGIDGAWFVQKIFPRKPHLDRSVCFSIFTTDNNLYTSNAILLSLEESQNYDTHFDWGYLRIQTLGTEDSIRVSIVLNKNQDLIISATKLEFGSHQTLARQNTDGQWALIDPPDYALQYALCSQYSPITGEFVGSQQSNENLLDNWYFPDLINQRGKAEYTSTSQTYFVDRWKFHAGGGTYNVTTNQFTAVAKTWSGIIQYVEAPDRLIGKRLTFSFIWSADIPITIRIAGIVNSSSNVIVTKKIPAHEINEMYSVTGIVPNGITALTVQIFNSDSSSSVQSGIMTPIAAKLELGPVQTLAHKEGDTWVLNDPPPNKALELAKCQRYQSVLTANGNNITIATGRCLSDGNITVALPIGPLRIIPANIANPTGLIAATDIFSGTTVPITAVTFIGYRPGEKMITALFKCPAGTVGTIYRVGLLSGNSLVFDANL